MAAAYTLAILATIFVILRFWARWTTRSQPNQPGVRLGIRADDWTCAAALPLYWGLAVEAHLWAVHGKIGFHAGALTPGQLVYFGKVSVTSSSVQTTR